jgi:Uma2 family endonuclease
MATRQAAPITVEQFLNFKAPPGYRAELLHGEIILSPDPKPLHHDVVLNIYRALHQMLGATWRVGTRCNMDFTAEHYMPSPDVFVMDLQKWLTARAGNVYPEGSPILAVEVVSPSNTKTNVLDKKALYLRNGSSAVWVVYPNEKIVDVYRRDGTAAGFNALDDIPLPHELSSVFLRANDFFV